MEMAIIDMNNMGVTTVGRIDRSSDLFPELKYLDDYAGSFYKTMCANSRRIDTWDIIVNDVALNGCGYTWFENGDNVYVFGAVNRLLEQGVNQFFTRNNEVKLHPDKKVSLVKVNKSDSLSYEDIVWKESVFLTYAETGFAPLSIIMDELGLDEIYLPELQKEVEQCNRSDDSIFPLLNKSVACLPNAIVRDGALHSNDVCEYLMRWWRQAKKISLPSSLYLDFSAGRSYPDHLVMGVEKFREVVAREDIDHCMDIHLFGCD